MGLKMVKDDVGHWVCKDCGWKGKAHHKAKAHARNCSLRKKQPKKTLTKKKFHCSYEGCDDKFRSKKKLSAHYRYIIKRMCYDTVFV